MKFNFLSNTTTCTGLFKGKHKFIKRMKDVNVAITLLEKRPEKKFRLYKSNSKHEHRHTGA